MSIEAVSWAMSLGSEISDHKFRVLIALADCHNPRKGSYPSVAFLVESTGKSRQTVFRVIKELEQDGYLKREHRSSGAGRLSNRYVLPLDGELFEVEQSHTDETPLSHTDETLANVTPVRPPKSHARDHLSHTGETGNRNRTVKRTVRPPIVPQSLIDETFDQWWSLYPRKTGKGAAKKAFIKMAKIHGLEVLCTGLEWQIPKLKRDMTRDPPNNYCPHPATWLNAERFLDDRPAQSLNNAPTTESEIPF